MTLADSICENIATLAGNGGIVSLVSSSSGLSSLEIVDCHFEYVNASDGSFLFV